MSKRGIVLYLHVHQPYRLRPFTVFDTGLSHSYTDETSGESWDNKATFLKVADKSYRPMNQLLLSLLESQPDFRLSLSISGVFIEQAQKWASDVLDSFRQLVATGRVEILGETYQHSLAFFFSKPEFEAQVSQHKALIEHEFGITPRVFRGTELSYNNELAAWADAKGYDGIIAEGWDPILEWRSPNYLYRPVGTERIQLLLKNYRLSDDLAFRFSNKSWKEWPLTTPKYNDWLDKSLGEQAVMNLFMDYETFGEHQWQDTGIFSFFEEFVSTWLQREDNAFYTVSEAIATHPAEGELSVPYTTTWADSTRDLSAWTGNSLQREALRYIYSLEDDILRTEDTSLIEDWRRLQTSDHFYYMSTKGMMDGEVHEYFSPYQSPYVAFLYYLNVIRDLRWRLHVHHKTGGLNG